MNTTSSFDGVKLAYRTLGNGPKNVVLVHGWSVSGDVWNELIERISLDGLRLVVPDLRGSGRSDKPDDGYTVETHAKDVLAVADAAGATTFTLVGHSMGGAITQWVASTAPERVKGVVLLNSVPASGLQVPDPAFMRGSGRDIQKTRAILGLACKALSPSGLERMLKDAATCCPAAVEQGFDSWSAGGFAERLQRITAPTLVVATEDPFLPVGFLKENVASRIRGARMAILPGAGHYPQNERPAETAAIIEGFLAASP